MRPVQGNVGVDLLKDVLSRGRGSSWHQVGHCTAQEARDPWRASTPVATVGRQSSYKSAGLKTLSLRQQDSQQPSRAAKKKESASRGQEAVW
jgi:hypothetical protein